MTPRGRTCVRRWFIGCLLALSPLLTLAGSPAPGLTFGITPVFLVDQNAFLVEWRVYLERRLQRPVTFVRRKSYAEITDLLLHGQLDAAWVCAYSYAAHRDHLPVLTTPLFRGEPFYQSYLIVPVRDTATQGYAELAGRVFAYVEPRSNSGYLVPRDTLRRRGIDPNHAFRASFFTWSHPDVVAAVADGLADAGAVDGYIWEVLAHRQPGLTARTRVVERSERYGFPPIVAGPRLDAAGQTRLREVLAGMQEDPEGQRLLAMLELDGFGPPRPELYDNVPLPAPEPVFGAVPTAVPAQDRVP